MAILKGGRSTGRVEVWSVGAAVLTWFRWIGFELFLLLGHFLTSINAQHELLAAHADDQETVAIVM